MPLTLVIIVGRTPVQLAGTPHSVQVTSIAAAVPGSTGGDQAVLPPTANGLRYIPTGLAAAGPPGAYPPGRYPARTGCI